MAYCYPVWDPDTIRFEPQDDSIDDPVMTLRVITSDGVLLVMADVTQNGTTLIASGLHMHGEGLGPNTVGAGNLRILAQLILQEMDYDQLVIEGAVRTTGARPGHRPGRLRFTRKPASGSGGGSRSA
jgi:hypothetical protein